MSTNTQEPKSKEELEAMINSTVSTINEILKKSGYEDGDEMKKGGPVLDPGGVASIKGAFGGGVPAQPAPAPMAMSDENPAAKSIKDAFGPTSKGGVPAQPAPAPMAQSDGAEDADQEGASAPEGAEGQEGGDDAEMQAMAEHLGSMPDEELHMLLELLQSEMTKRTQGSEGQEGAPAPEGAEGHAEPDGDEGQQLQMSMKKEFASLAKSMESMAKAVETLAQNQNAIKEEVAGLKKSSGKASVSRPAAANRDVQVMQKSAEPAKQEVLTKSDLEGFMMNEMRKSSSQRHPAINANTIAELTYVKTPEQVSKFASNLRKQGVQLPS